MDGIRNSKENLIGVSDGDSDSDIVWVRDSKGWALRIVLGLELQKYHKTEGSQGRKLNKKANVKSQGKKEAKDEI